MSARKLNGGTTSGDKAVQEMPNAVRDTKMVQNPFVHSVNLSWLDCLQVALMTVTVVPIRALGIIIMLLIANGFARIALWGRDKSVQHKDPLSGWRCIFRTISLFFCRLMFLCGGFHWITEKGKRASSAVAPILVAASHSSLLDALFCTYIGLPPTVAKSGTENIPLIGVIASMAQPILVLREDPHSRQNTTKEIRRRAETGGKWPQILIFAEGTCTNQTSVISFKPGAFIPGVPIQPVCIKYWNKMKTHPWTWNGPAALKLLWLTLTQFHTSLEIEFLPVYTPSADEKEDPLLFGRNVRAIMAKALGVPTSEYTYEDGLAMMHSLALPIACELTYINCVVRSLPLKMASIIEMLPQLCTEMVSSGKKYERVNIETFASHLRVDPSSDAVKQLFDYYRRDDDDDTVTVDMRPLVVHLHMLCRTYTNLETIKFAFQVYDHSSKGYVTSSELRSLLTSLGCQANSAPIPSGDQISYDYFIGYARSMPDYSSWFTQSDEQRKKNKKKLGHQRSGSSSDVDEDNTKSKHE